MKLMQFNCTAVFFLRIETTFYRFIRVFALIAFTLLASGCARDYAYRSILATCDVDISGQDDSCAEHSMVRHKTDSSTNNLLGFVEFDDQGQLRNQRQMKFVLDSFYEVASKEDILLIVFVHGWHHNASHSDSNIIEFSKLLDKVTKSEALAGHRKVLGLYVGWRGESILVPVVNDLTFWERKNTAHKVGGNEVVELFLKLEEIVNIKKGLEDSESKPHNSRIVVIGHSFGGAVVYASLQQILADRFIDSRDNKLASYNVKGFGDLVVLMNPAFEALRFSSLYDLSQERCSYFSGQLPKMAILTSEADWATGLAFPAGRFFSTIFESHNTIERSFCQKKGRAPLSISEGDADRSTVGHFEPYQTHALHAVKDRTLAAQTLSPQGLKQLWKTQDIEDYSQTFSFGETSLEHLGRSHPLNPYLNIRVDADLIPDHNKIWDDRIKDFIRDLIAISTLPNSATNGNDSVPQSSGEH